MFIEISNKDDENFLRNNKFRKENHRKINEFYKI